MTTLTLPMTSPNSLKRTYAVTELEHPTNVKNLPSAFQATIMPSSTASTHNNAHSPPPSQAPQTSPPPSSPLIPNSSVLDAGTAAATAPSTVIQPPVKKAKLTFAEKEARRAEKEFEDRQKAEEKAKKDEEKAKKEAKREEDKRVKEAEKEEKLRAREVEKRLKLEEQLLKDEEKHRKEEEKIKKARVRSHTCTQSRISWLTFWQSQLLINSFFPQPSGANCAASGLPTRNGPSPLSSRRSSISETNAIEEKRRSRSVSTTPQKPRLPDYERSFPPFFVKVHTALAPSNRFSRDKEGLSIAQKKIDESLKGLEDGDVTEGRSRTFDAIELLHVSRNDGYRRPPRVNSVKDIIAEIDGAAHNPIDLTESQFAMATKKPLDLLRKIPVKYLKFAEDVRPPYMGTYTRLRDAQSISKLARNPFSRGLPEANYEYDSEAEWEELGEGEDLDSEGEEEEVDEDEAEMNDFLDDAEVADTRAVKRRPILGNLEPTCSGLCWDGPQSKGSGPETIDLLMFKLDILMGETPRQKLSNQC